MPLAVVYNPVHDPGISLLMLKLLTVCTADSRTLDTMLYLH